MDNRTAIQREAILAWINNSHSGTIILSTGMGKTRVGCTIAGEQLKKNLISSVLIVVPTIPLIQQWKDEFEKWNYDHINVDIACLKTAYKMKHQYDLLIIDEIHTSLSPEYRALYSNIQYNQILGLTATLPHNEEYRKLLSILCPVVHTTTVEEAVKADAVSTYTIYNYEVSLNRKDRGRYQIFDRNLKEAQMELSILKRQDNILKEMSIFDVARVYSTKKEKTPLVKYAKQFWSSMSMRKWICYEAESKLDYVKAIIDKYPNRKWIIFNKSIKYAELLVELIPNSVVYHSKMKDKDREQVLEDFKSNKYRYLICVDALTAGLNVPDTDSAICVAGTSVELTQIQALGRITRKVEDKHAIFINLYSKNTVEENWVRKKTEKLNNTYWITKISQIRVQPLKEGVGT